MAIAFCTLLEEIAPQYGAHVALTGGCLYKTENRKDIDIIFYRIRQKDRIDINGLFDMLFQKLGVVVIKKHNKWLTKAKWNDRAIDFFFPEEGVATNVHNSAGYDDV